MTTTWKCSKCGTILRTNIKLTYAPTCDHNYRFGRNRTTVMEAQDATMSETNEPEQRGKR
jgi:ABC-type ATPase with predicted acetyltransferase domain